MLIHELELHRIELEMQNEQFRRAQLGAEESRAKYVDLYEFAPVGYLTLTREGRVRDLNFTAAALLGVERDHLVNKPLGSFIQKESRDAFYLHMRKVLESVTKQVSELLLKRKDGTLFHAQLESVPVENEGQPMVRAVLTDISERKRAEEALKESEERYRTAIENAFDGIALVRGDRHLYVNAKFAEIFGYEDPEEIIGKPLSLTVHPDDLKMVSEFNRVRQKGKAAPWRYEFKGVRKDGTLRFIEASAAATTYRGEPVSLVYLRDITDYKRLKDRLLQSQKMEAIGTLSGGIAHDFNNILAGIIGFTEMALDNLPSHSPERRHLELVLKSGFRGRDLVKQILAFSRKTKPRREPVSLSAMVSETLKLLRASLPATTSIAVKIDAKEDTVLANPSELQQIIMNLSTNAAHAMGDRGGELDVTLAEIEIDSVEPHELAPGHYVELTVKDTGTGMDEEVMKRIFEPFFTTKGPAEGSGMGLSVVYGIVKSLNGDIAVKSTPGIGTAFHVLLPRAAAAAPPEIVAEIPRGKERILFVDDEELLAELGEEMLKGLGYKVTAMTDGIEALKVFSKHPSRFELVFTDQTMPEITGLELAQELFKIRPDIPVILCTGHSDSVSSEKALAMGIRGFLMKPLSKRELAVALRSALDAKAET